MSGLPETKRPRGGIALRRRDLSKIASPQGNNSMKRNVTRRRRARNDGGLPLFDFADAQRRQPARTAAARDLQRRFGFSGPTASLYASLAGFAGEGE
jgi:hypothetical protein